MSRFPILKALNRGDELLHYAEDDNRFRFGRREDHLVCHFECDVCHFRNIQKRYPIKGNNQDHKLLEFIRRANLDTLWSRQPSTPRETASEIRNGIKYMSELGLSAEKILPPMGPWPLEDTVGMGYAVVILRRLLEKGCTTETVLFQTSRKTRAAISNLWHASLDGGSSAMMVKGKTKVIESKSPTNGAWFEKFMAGFHNRVGDQTRPDRAISLEVMIKLQNRLASDFEKASTSGDEVAMLKIACLGAFAIWAYCGGLRGEEIVLAHLGGIRRYWDEARGVKTPHVPLALRGRFKGKVGKQWHYLPLADETHSGLKPYEWTNLLIIILEKKSRRWVCFRNWSIEGTYYQRWREHCTTRSG